MNAGAMGLQTFDRVVSVRYLNLSGEIVEKSADEITTHYRNVPELEDNFVLSATFEGANVAIEDIDKNIEISKAKRRSSQPIAASAGCIFKNPEACPAGKLVEDLGLKNHYVGKARVSDVHGNFIVNEGGARAADVIALIESIKDVSRRERGIELETEVQIIGEVAPVA